MKNVGEGVLEYKVDFGPGYRIYFGRDGDTIVILLTGSGSSGILIRPKIIGGLTNKASAGNARRR